MECSKYMNKAPFIDVRNKHETASVNGVGNALDPYVKSLTAIGGFDRFYNRCHKPFLRKQTPVRGISGICPEC